MTRARRYPDSGIENAEHSLYPNSVVMPKFDRCPITIPTDNVDMPYPVVPTPIGCFLDPPIHRRKFGRWRIAR